VPAIAERFPAKVLDHLARSNNEIYALLEDVPRYLALGVLKIQGRQYPAPLIAELTRIYRRVMDEAAAGVPDLDAARTALDPALAERARWGSAKTPSTGGSWRGCETATGRRVPTAGATGIRRPRRRA
jgi:hypothetical protein